MSHKHHVAGSNPAGSIQYENITMFLRLPPNYHFPNKLWVACSGGSDSMALLNFLRSRDKREVSVAYFNHQTTQADAFQNFVFDFCENNKIDYRVGHISEEKSKGQSQEEYWREQRYQFFGKLDGPVFLGHNLDDVVETWIFSSFHGNAKLLPWSREGKYFRPLLLNKKQDLKKYCEEKNIPWIEDFSNTDLRFSRNRIRHRIMPEALFVNPGLYTTIKNKLLETFKPQEI